jgi:transposase
MLPGTQRLVLTPGNNEKCYLAGAYDPWNHRLVYVAGDRKASWIFLNLLRALLEAYDRTETIHVILDNYIIHKSRVTQAWLAEFGDRLKLHFLPPYCPSENRIERLWLDLHANVTRNHRQRTIDALLDRVHGTSPNASTPSAGSCWSLDAESPKVI